MITNNTYYRGELYIPQAKPSITETALEPENDFAFILDKYEEDCLIKCLGPKLYEEFIAELDSNQSNLLKVGSDVKWDRLLNGHVYTKVGESTPVRWKGIRYKVPRSNAAYNGSFLAKYVYFFYERKQFITTTNAGTGIQKSENLTHVAPTQKVVEAWNEFVTEVQGKNAEAKILYNTAGFTGLDFYRGNDYIPLYEFINDMNALQSDYYAEFEPTEWAFLNKFGI